MLNIKQSALVIIDIQDKLVMASKYGSEVATNTAKLAKAANILAIPTIVTEQYPQGLGSTVAEVQDSLSTTYSRFEKKAFSALLEEEISLQKEKLAKIKSLCILRRNFLLTGIAGEKMNIPGYPLFNNRCGKLCGKCGKLCGECE